MKILFLYPNHEGYFRCPVGLTLIMTVVANEGHEVKLFDTTFMNVGENVDNKIRENIGIVKPVPLDHFFNKKSKSEIENSWLKKLDRIDEDEESMLDQAFYVNNSSRLSCQIEFNEKLDGIELTLAPE